MTICCRKCKTQVTVGEAPDARPPRWYRTPYWLAVCAAEVAAAAALAVCVSAAMRARPPAGIPLLAPEVTGGAPALPAPGTQVPFAWTTDLESAGGHFTISGQNVVLQGSGQPPLPDVAFNQNPWPADLLRSSQVPPPRPIAVAFRVTLPDDPELAGAEVRLSAAVNLDYPGWSEPGGAVSIQQRRINREWVFAVATHGQQEAYERHLRALAWLRAGSVLLGILLIAIPFGAGVLAQRSLNVQCPKCGRVTICTYYVGGSKLYMSPCPHHGRRPVEVRGARAYQ